jgi:endonuclease/exonuclease/phosphatase family metal-dependent hydrolase
LKTPPARFTQRSAWTSSPADPMADAEPVRLRIAVSNLQSGIGTTRGYWHYLLTGWKYFLPHDSGALDGAVRFLCSERIDIAALAEANGSARRSRGVDQVALIADRGSLPHHEFFPTHVVGTKVNQGNAVCSRFPVRPVANHRLFGIGEPRFLSEAEIDIHGTPIRILATHLALDLGQRAKQIHEIVAIVRERHGFPTILAGDFNVSREEEIELFAETQLQMATSAATYPSWKPSRRLDYLFFSGEFTILESHAWSATRFSDHLPLVAEVLFRPGSATAPILTP